MPVSDVPGMGESNDEAARRQVASHQLAAQLATRNGNHARAVRHMQDASKLAPDRADLHFQLACLLAHGGQFHPAIEHFRIATRQAPGHAEAWRLLGAALARVGDDAGSLEALRRAHALAPDDPAALRALADVEFRAGWPSDALPRWRALLDARPEDVEARLRTGECLSRLGDQDAAVACFREGVALQPGSDALWLALAQAQEDAGQADAARRSYETALRLHPDWPFALACLVGQLRGNAPDALIERASALADQGLVDDGDRALLGYALGKAHDARGEHARAIARWDDANAARRRIAGDPDPAALRARVDRIIEAFPGGGAPSAGASDDDRFVFVVGMPRSGTTLTEQILASHPQVHGCGELPDLAMVAHRIGTRAMAVGEAIDRYVSAATRHAPASAVRLVDKEPLNFFHLGLVASLFPRARVIWCRRDPRDIAVSIYGENFALDEPLATTFGGIGAYINEQVRLMRHWQSTLSLPIVECHYESLVASPEAQARRLVDFTGLPWDPACLEFHRNTRAVQSPSRWQVRQPVHARSVGRWRNYAAALAPLLDVLDADATSPHASTPSRWTSGS